MLLGKMSVTPKNQIYFGKIKFIKKSSITWKYEKTIGDENIFLKICVNSFRQEQTVLLVFAKVAATNKKDFICLEVVTGFFKKTLYLFLAWSYSQLTQIFPIKLDFPTNFDSSMYFSSSPVALFFRTNFDIPK